MGRDRLVRIGLLATALALGSVVACSSDDTASSKDAGGDTAADAAIVDAATQAGDAAVPGECPEPAPNQPPDSLSCTGLYADIGDKTLGDGVHEYAPAVEQWADGATSQRFVFLPAGEKIDVSDPDAWSFPVGTKFWQELSSKGKRVETRLFWKLSSSFWARTAYRWNSAGTEAMRTGGEALKVGGETYRIPSTTECDQCHKGRVDRILGFETLLLGLPGATGMTLTKLKSDGLLRGGKLPAKLEIGDDGTGHAADALLWLHANCGVSCHNANIASEGHLTKMDLQVRVEEADGRSPAAFHSLTTTLDVAAVTGRWLGRTRLVAGSPDESLLLSLMSTRNATNMKDQMPPIATRVLPAEGVALVRDWITAMVPDDQDAGTN